MFQLNCVPTHKEKTEAHTWTYSGLFKRVFFRVFWKPHVRQQLWRCTSTSHKPMSESQTMPSTATNVQKCACSVSIYLHHSRILGRLLYLKHITKPEAGFPFEIQQQKDWEREKCYRQGRWNVKEKSWLSGEGGNSSHPMFLNSLSSIKTHKGAGCTHTVWHEAQRGLDIKGTTVSNTFHIHQMNEG